MKHLKSPQVTSHTLPTTQSISPLADQQAIHLNPAIAYLLTLGSDKSRQTMQSYLNIVARMLGATHFHDLDWSRVERHHIQAIIEQLRLDHKAPSTINTYLSALKGVAQEAWSAGLISTDHYQHIRHIRSVKGSRISRGRALTAAEVQQLLAVCEADTSLKGVRDSAIIALLVGCGLRRSEIVALELKDRIEQEMALLVLGKGNRERLSYVPQGAWRRMQFWIEEVRGSQSGQLFTRIRRFDDVTMDPLSDQAIYHILQLRRKQAGIRYFAPHDLRRTFATNLLNNGEDLVIVKDAMGHQSITTTQAYDQRGSEKLKRASQRLII